MNQESASLSGSVDSGQYGHPPGIPLPGSPLLHHKFQNLLLRLSTAASEHPPSADLIQQFCTASREFFQASGVYFWRSASGDDLIGETADGRFADRFSGLRPNSQLRSFLSDAVRTRKVVLANHIRPPDFPAPQELEARSLVAVPVLVLNEVIGVAMFLHDSDPTFFTPDLSAKATILTGQLGTLLEANRLTEVSREEQRRAEILAEVVRALHGTPDLASIVEALADRLRVLLRTRLVCVFLRREGPFELRAVSAESSQFAESVRSRHDRQTMRFAADLAQRAVDAGEPITVSVSAESHSLGSLVSSGMLLAAPFRSSRTQGAILIYPRPQEAFTAEERSLVAATAGFSAVAIANAELYATAQAQAHELQQLLDISAELSSSGNLDQFLQAFALRAGEFLSFGRCFIALHEEGIFRVRYGVDHGRAVSADNVFPEGIATRALRAKEVFWSDDARQLPGANLEALAQYEVHQVLAVPLLGCSGDVLGMFGVLDRVDGAGISQEDIRRARALSNHVAVVLEVTRNLHLSDQHRRRAEALNHHWLELFDAITDFVVVHDKQDNVLHANRSLCNMIGVPASELVGVTMRSLLAIAGDTASYSCPFCHSSDNSTDEFVHPVMDRTYLVSTSRVNSASGDGLQTIHILKDITDRREAERRYRELFDNIQEGIFFSTPDGRFIEVNDALVRMLGYSSREELLQVDIPGTLYFSPEDRQREIDLMIRDGHLRNFEATLRRRNGSPIHLLLNSFGLYAPEGHLLQIRGLALDVTGLRAYQSELHRERDFSAKILNNTQSLILVVDTAGLISYMNQRWSAAGFDQIHLLGQPLLNLASSAYAQALSEALNNTLEGQQVDNLEVEILRRGGAPGKFSANLSPMRDEQGNVTSIVVVLTDITDSAILRDKLLHAEKMAAVGQLVSGVAHEVNNPLTAILGFSDLLLQNPEIPEPARKDLRVILQEAQRTKQIVQNLLSFARQMPPQRDAVEINSVLRRTVQLRSYDFTSHGIDIIQNLDENLPQVLGDAHQLQQVFLNILNNAYDAVHEVGRAARIEIMTTKAGDAVEISFRDNGPGISHPDRIFDPFFTTKEIGKGTGLGLSICYGIVKEHGGEILCHNNSDGHGATFVVRLPSASHSSSLGVAAGVRQP